jgi:hypothetical protein
MVSHSRRGAPAQVHPLILKSGRVQVCIKPVNFGVVSMCYLVQIMYCI